MGRSKLGIASAQLMVWLALLVCRLPLWGQNAAVSGRAGLGKVVAIVSGGNIDLDKFAMLTGAA